LKRMTTPTSRVKQPVLAGRAKLLKGKQKVLYNVKRKGVCHGYPKLYYVRRFEGRLLRARREDQQSQAQLATFGTDPSNHGR
jgi:hypothetical protein